MSTDAHYHSASLKLPRLTGRTLRLAIRLLENPLTRWLLVRRLLRDGGITRLREQSVAEIPSFQPYTSYQAPLKETKNASALLSLAAAPAVDCTGYASIDNYLQAYRCGATTPEEVARQVLDAIADSDSRDPPLRAFISCQSDDVMRQARASGQRWRNDNPLGSFDGVPVAVKDEFDQMPYATTQGTCFLQETLTGQDATIVARLRAAGALLIGKTNMHEFGAGVTGHNPHHGTVRNPYNPSHHTGGSSSGSAAAVAAGLCPVALGTDGGGSIRIPAAFCGIVGLKPTYGRISNFGATSHGCSVSQSGPITATAHDAALTYALLAGPDAKDWVSLRQPPPTLEGFAERKLTDITLGIYRPWFEHASSVMVTVCYELLSRLEKRGAKIRDVEIPDLDAGRIGHIVTIVSEMANALDPYYAGQRQHFSLEARLNLVLGRSLYSRDYVQAQRWRTRMMNHFYRALREVDVIVTPATGCTAPLIEPDALEQGMSDLSLLTEIMRFVVPANFIGFPAITFPAGYDNEGLPVGFHVIGRPWQEHLLLRLAYVAEDLVERKLSLLHYRLLPEC